MRTIEFFEKKGLKWTTEALFFSTLVMAITNSDTDLVDYTNEFTTDVLNHGGDMRVFRARNELIRKSLVFINTRTEANLRDNKADVALLQRLSQSFKISEYISFVRRVRSNSITPTLFGTFLRKLARDLQITNAKLKSFMSLVIKFPNLPMKQQIDTLYKMRNYATINYRRSEFTSALTTIHTFYTSKYSSEERYTQKVDNMSDNNQDERNEKLTGFALLAAIAMGTVKMTKALNGLHRKREPSWALKQDGKAQHRGYDDHYRN